MDMRPSGTREEIDRRGNVGATDGGVNSMTTLRCPRCGGTEVRRARRHGALERLLSALYIYPFRCQHCQRRFRRLEWGVRYRIGLDRRIDERLRVRGRADLRWEGGHAAGTVRDVSVMGAGIETETTIPSGTPLTLVLQPAPDLARITIAVAGTQWARARRLGVQFRHIETGEQSRLQQLVYTLRARSGRPRV
jgi:hypothetical protein